MLGVFKSFYTVLGTLGTLEIKSVRYHLKFSILGGFRLTGSYGHAKTKSFQCIN